MMIYRSNLRCPDFTPQFRHLHSRPMGHSFGHSVPSDWKDKADDDPVFGIYKRCGMWTHDEAAILWNVAERVQLKRGLDIGCHTGWTTVHMGVPGIFDESPRMSLAAIDPMIRVPEFHRRFIENGAPAGVGYQTSAQYFAPLAAGAIFGLICIDGDHTAPIPVEDASNSLDHLGPDGVIMLHDGTGKPVRDAVRYLMTRSMHCRAYFTPHLVFCCWRGKFTPPLHHGDPAVKAQLTDGRFDDFDWSQCE
jgi:Methyltransferase domain